MLKMLIEYSATFRGQEQTHTNVGGGGIINIQGEFQKSLGHYKVIFGNIQISPIKRNEINSNGAVHSV